MNTDYPIESGVPRPTGSRRPKYRWAEMSVGDSFFVAARKDQPQEILQHRMDNIARAWSHRNDGGKFSTTQVTEGGIDGVRVWRTA